MAFQLIEKRKIINQDFNDKFVILKTAIKFPMKLRKKDKGFYNYVKFYFDDENENIIAFEFTDDIQSGYVISKDRLLRMNRKFLAAVKEGVYDYTFENNLYIIDMSKNLNQSVESDE